MIGTASYLFDDASAALTAFLVFQLGFIGSATTLMTGPVTERMRFSGYLVSRPSSPPSPIPSSGTGPGAGPSGGGGDGWLRELGFIDFAGSTVMHSIGGWSTSVFAGRETAEEFATGATRSPSTASSGARALCEWDEVLTPAPPQPLLAAHR